MANTLRMFALAAVTISSLAIAGCGDGGGTVQPPKVEPTPPTSGPVDEPPSTDEK
jgi:predicted small lipoprotein YifL